MSLFVLYYAAGTCAVNFKPQNLSIIPVTLSPDSTDYLVRPCE